jgi:hypothetical protein
MGAAVPPATDQAHVAAIGVAGVTAAATIALDRAATGTAEGGAHHSAR